jgi:Armadillo/beta-catenin-like repeat
VLIEHGAACLAAMSLRSPGNSVKIVECGAIEVLVRCMRAHSDKASMQRQGTPHSVMLLYYVDKSYSFFAEHHAPRHANSHYYY